MTFTAGARLSKLKEWVKEFYDDVDREAASRASSPFPNNTQSIDDRFLTKVWRWLAKQSDVFIGKDREFDKIPLEHFQSDGEGFSSVSSAAENPLKLFVSDDLTYRITCGHSLDLSKLSSLEYTLLSAIAATGRDGILQGNLTRFTGQDKRSVPKRTNDLQSKGYIVKQDVYVKGTKTSRLTLRRYVKNSTTLTPGGNEYAAPVPDADVSVGLRVRDVVAKLNDFLANGALVELDYLTHITGIEGPVAAKILSRILRQLEKIGCTKRVKAAFGPSAHAGDLKTHIQLLKSPSRANLEDLEKNGLQLNRAMGEWANSEAMKSCSIDHPLSPNTLHSQAVQVQGNPDRLVTNQLLEVVAQSGAEGLTNVGARRATTGMLVRRTLESILAKISHRSLISQPESLQHLAIVRSTRLSNGALEYVHYSLPDFIKGVQGGTIDSSVVPGAQLLLKSHEEANSTIQGQEDMESWLNLSSNDSHMAMGELIQYAKSENVHCRPGEPQIIRDDQGCELIQAIPSPLPDGVSRSRIATPSRKRRRASKHKPSPENLAEQRNESSWRKRRRLSRASMLAPEEHVSAAITPTPQNQTRSSRATQSEDQGSSAAPPARPRRRKASKKAQWLEEESETDAATPKKVHRKRAGIKVLEEDSDERPQGRPRRFVRGTEKFWQYHFWQARLAYTEEEGIPSSKGGTMHDPAGVRLFNSRPEGFDETLVAAIAVGLPIPAAADDISSEWLRIMRNVLERTEDGAYITSVGMYLGRVKHRSQIAIFRSSRLSSVDWNEFTHVPAIRFMSSSAAHTFSSRRYYPQMAKPPRKTPRPQKKARETEVKPTAVPPEAEEHPELLTLKAHAPPFQRQAINGRGPPVGVFTEAAALNTTLATSAGTLQTRDGMDINAFMDTTDSEGEAERSAAAKGSLTGRKAAAHNGTNSVFELRRVTTAQAMPQSSSNESAPSRTPSSSAPPTSEAVIRRTPSLNRQDPTSRLSLQVANPAALVRENDTDLAFDVLKYPDQAHDVGFEASEGSSLELWNHVGAVRANDILSREETTVATGDRLVASNPETTQGHCRPQDAIMAMHDGAGDQDAPSQPAKRAQYTEVPAIDDAAVKVHADEESDDSESLAPEEKGAVKRRAKRRSGARVLCAKIVHELVLIARGAAPNNRSTLRRCMANRWQAAGQKDRPLMKPIKSGVENLVISGVVKEHIFVFKGKGGTRPRRSILHLPSIDIQSEQIAQLKQNIIDADATEYTPPEWVAETLPTLNLSGSRRKQTVPPDRPPLQPLPSSQNAALRPMESLLAGENTQSGEQQTMMKTRRPKRTPEKAKRLEDLNGDTPDSSISPEPESSAATGFLTLKVPNLGSLQQVQSFNINLREPSWKAFLPSVPLKFNAEASAENVTALPTPTNRRKSGMRKPKPKQTSYNETTRKIVWAQPEQRLPDDLEHLLRLEAIRGNLVEEHEPIDQAASVFRTIDVIASWEEREADFISSQKPSRIYINLEGPPDLQDNMNVATWHLVTYHDSSEGKETEQTIWPSWDPFVAVLQPKLWRRRQLTQKRREQQAKTNLLAAPGRRVTRISTGAVKKRKWNAFAEETREPHDGVASAEALDTAFTPPDPEEEPETLNPKRQRSPVKTLKAQTTEAKLSANTEIHQFAIGVVVVQTLAGGVEKEIKWSYVQKLYPRRREQSLKDWWKTVQPRFRHQISTLADDFQDKYLDALQHARAPPVDLDSVNEVDWESVVDWASDELQTSRDKPDEVQLIGSREELLNSRAFCIEESRSLRDMFNYKVLTSDIIREELYSGVVGGIKPRLGRKALDTPLGEQSQLPFQDLDQAVAKSLLIAIIQTSETVFEAAIAEERLAMLSNDVTARKTLIKQAMESLKHERLVVRSLDDEMDKEGFREWQLSDMFEDVFVSRRTVNRAILNAAAAFKLKVLDTSFARGDVVTIAADAIMDDGDMLAILNLVGQNQIQIRPGNDVPNSRYGIDWENVGYQGRNIDKSKVNFSTVLQPTALYQYGKATSVSTEVSLPRGGIDDPRGLIPLWIDLTGNLLVDWWELALAAILGLLSVRSGLTTDEVVRILNSALSTPEVEWILEWAQQAGFAKRTESLRGWTTADWWWMALANDTEWV